uniref:Carbohydrate deacetylase n=1 Tax=Nothobranchius furzeri TaxID=105023 RepID=A0A8C6NXE5_NOTFU
MICVVQTSEPTESARVETHCCSSSARYEGALPCSTLNTWRRILNVAQYNTDSQCREASTKEEPSQLAEKTHFLPRVCFLGHFPKLNVKLCFVPRWPDVYLGLTTMGQNMSSASLQRSLSGLHPAVVTAELMVHPGYPSYTQEGGCGGGPDDFSQSSDREHELGMLTEPSVQELYRRERVQLCGFKDL